MPDLEECKTGKYLHVNAAAKPLEISSPNWAGGGNYYDGLNCFWLVKAPEDATVLVYIANVTIRAGDWMDVRGGPSVNSQLLFKCASMRCGGRGRSVRSSNRYARVNFVTNSAVVAAGFRLFASVSGVAAGPSGRVAGRMMDGSESSRFVV